MLMYGKQNVLKMAYLLSVNSNEMNNLHAYHTSFSYIYFTLLPHAIGHFKIC